MMPTTSLFSLHDQVAVISGGSGALGGSMASGLAAAGAKVAILGRSPEKIAARVHTIKQDGGEAIGLSVDVLDEKSLQDARDTILQKWGHIDILVNSAGGNMPGATISPDKNFFDLSIESFRQVIDLNLMGSVLPTFVFGEAMATHKKGSILNISSMTAQQPFTRVVGYGAAKAGIDNFTKWLAVEMASKYGEGIRVNAIAPGVFVGEQNEKLLFDEHGNPTPRAQTIIDHTPMKRFGKAEELIGTAIWLCSPGAAFVTGIIVPVDGGFSAFSGV